MASRQRKPKASAEDVSRQMQIAARARALQDENPTWSWGKCLVTAKLERNK